jgi:EAL domain-containing protein (putative c-di-GMP-specific phosphodiesterase class I)
MHDDGRLQTSATTARAKGASEAASSRKVLVVDDDEALALSLKRVLGRVGFDVSVAHSAEQAVDALRLGSFDVILSDICLPRMSGVELLRKVRERDLDVPVILMTGTPSVDTAMAAVSLGALQYLPKPTPKEIVVAAVERAWKLRRIAEAKREALRVNPSERPAAGDLAGLDVSFERALGGLWMAFQPIVDWKNRRLFGYEALMRSQEPTLPHPGAMLSAAERLDRLFDLGRCVRAKAATAFDEAPAGTLLFVNLHTRDLFDPTLFETTAPLVRHASRVVLEITERAAVDDVNAVRERVARLRGQGYRIAIDDLGAGWAGLSSFAALEPEIVKLDMSLVRGVHESPVRQRVIASVATMCGEMGMDVLAEGVETEAERDCVAALGCSLQQGYLFAKPGKPFPRVDFPTASS